jgi:hypothetical protein
MAHKTEKDIRVAATSRIWVLATVMLAICIPLSAITGSVLLPIAVILAAAVGTIAVWRSSDNQSKTSPLLTNSVKHLEQRVSNLEIICSSQELDLHSKIKHLE